MQKVKKIPQRQCVGCREMKDKKSLLRVVKSPEGAVSLDFVGKKARKSRALERALEVSIPAEVYDAMEAELEGRDGQE